MNKLTIAVLLGMIATAAAWCPNGCSGHGKCENGNGNTVKDSCTCFTRREWYQSGNGPTNSMVPAWQGADCSERTCPKGKAWAASPQANNNHEQLLECSGRGTCDRKTGLCKCFTGYEGEGCRRSTCPNQCSGHGICQDLLHHAADSFAQYNTAWDATYGQGCRCDAGFRGPDCSQIECPSGTDPLGAEDNRHGRDCSGRGLCDFSTGTCTCFSGYKGTRCEIQTVLN